MWLARNVEFIVNRTYFVIIKIMFDRKHPLSYV